MSEQYRFEQYQDREQNLPTPLSYLPVQPNGMLPATDQQPVSTAAVVVASVLTVVTGLYLLPWLIAVVRGKSNVWSIFAVNLLLGWTVVGWIVALVMSVSAHQSLGPVQLVGYAPTAAIAPVVGPAGWYPNPDGPGSRYWDGVQWTQHYA